MTRACPQRLKTDVKKCSNVANRVRQLSEDRMPQLRADLEALNLRRYAPEVRGACNRLPSRRVL